MTTTLKLATQKYQKTLNLLKDTSSKEPENSVIIDLQDYIDSIKVDKST